MTGLELRYFVLNPTKRDEYGAASRKAMQVYAEEIEGLNVQLAIDLREWILRIFDKMDEEEITPAPTTD